MNNRRKLVIALGAGAFAAPFGSFAQPQAKVWRVGFLYVLSRESAGDRIKAFSDGMREFGYVEGKNLVIELRFADGKTEQLPALATDLIQHGVEVIVTAGSPATSAVKSITATIPIVMANGNDPVREGFVKSLAHPGGNITGLSGIASDISPKRLEMLLNMAPKLTRVAVLVNPTNSSHAEMLRNIEAASRGTGTQIQPVEARTPHEIEIAFTAMSKGKAGAVILLLDGLFTVQRNEISALAAKHRLPSISVLRNYVEAGGLMSYGANVNDQNRRAAAFVDKIFKGAKPGDLPVERSTKFELIINRRTANALGLKIPQSLLVMADKVIE